jgi:hypothetical protein
VVTLSTGEASTVQIVPRLRRRAVAVVVLVAVATVTALGAGAVRAATAG